MYNRYIPQPDGSYRRNRVPDGRHRPTPPPPPPPQPEACPPEPPQQVQKRQCNHPVLHKKQPVSQHPDSSVTGFLRRLLPRDFDTGDLIIVLLLLLMAGDCTEDQNTALLTLALYVFM